MSENEQAQVRDHERAVDAFLNIEKELHEELERFNSGDFIAEILTAGSVEAAKARYIAFRAHIDNLIERHNVALNEAKNAMRALVQIGPTQWRGPEGKPDVVRYKAFSVSSVTKRGWNAETLFSQLERRGALPRYLALSKLDEGGNQVPLIEKVWKIDYEGILRQLRADGLEEVIEGAYEETESTPQVKGPKPLATLGEKKEK